MIKHMLLNPNPSNFFQGPRGKGQQDPEEGNTPLHLAAEEGAEWPLSPVMDSPTWKATQVCKFLSFGSRI